MGRHAQKSGRASSGFRLTITGHTERDRVGERDRLDSVLSEFREAYGENQSPPVRTLQSLKPSRVLLLRAVALVSGLR